MKRRRSTIQVCTILGALLCLGIQLGKSQINPGGGGGSGGGSTPTYTPIASWSFKDIVNWTSDQGYSPVFYTNIAYSYLGNGSSLVVNDPNQALMRFNVVEGTGATNLTVNSGTVLFWFGASWSSVSMGGNGPGVYGRLFETGAYTTNSSLGWWSIYVDPMGSNLFFSTQTNDYSGNFSNFLSAPIAWTTNYFHLVALTYSSTNTALYLDGVLATNGPPLTVYPGSSALANGLFIGSDSTGVFQAQGMFNDIYTFNVPVDGGTIQTYFKNTLPMYMMSPWNSAMFGLNSGNPDPVNMTNTSIISGQGNLQAIAMLPVVYGSNAFNVWITNVTATMMPNGTMTVTFGIEGGSDGCVYDVFAGPKLTSPLKNGLWTWQGQGAHGYVYSLSNLPQGVIFLVLGTPLDTDGDGLTDAYELLVSKTDPHNADTDGDGIPDGWSVMLGLNPLSSPGSSSSTRANYFYTGADWLNQILGVKYGGITADNEGNLQSVSQ